MPTRIPIFCTADLPASTLNTFLECLDETVEQYKREIVGNPMESTADYVIFMTSLDEKSISSNEFAPVEAFTSPFPDWSLERLRDWFKTNCTKVSGVTCNTFIVFDKQSAEDETCLLVDVHDSTAISSVRTDFYVPVREATTMEFGGEWLDESILGCFRRSGVVMTKENLKLASDGGMYIEEGEVKVDQAWKDFRNW
ncbi:hypothetical protein BDN70DRAFT_882798 [Pholiota conissans]|uniref:Uncharacterized protein n=1 Tax=Pholiota conissans TaxID=109636 RepID=A0A9P6CQR3_9AGAR|nr:hypothetical protein BDN70DRAFT_882798 [Pholiota conissans]